jgi:acetylglutamate kinase
VRLLEEGRLPVVAPLARGPLNVNGDEAAAALAVGLHADRLLFFTDVPGVYVDGAVAGSLSVAEAESLLAGGGLEGGIVPKLEAALVAARGGVATSIGATEISA